MPDYGFGLDIGSHNIKLACLKKVKKEIQLANLFLRKANEIDILKEDMSKFLSDNKLKEEGMVVSVSGPSVVVRYAEFPDMSEDEVRGAIALESERFLPFRLEDVNLDLQILKGAQESKGKMRVMIVAAKKDIIKKRLDFLESTGYFPIAIDVDALSIANCFEREKVSSANAIALLNIGAVFTNLSIIEDNLPCFTRDIPLGGNAINSHLERRLGFSSEEAESVKISTGLFPESQESDKEKTIKVNDAIKEVMQTFLKEIRYSFDFHQSQGKGKILDKIYLSGGISLMKDIDKFFSTELGVHVEIWDPLKVFVSPKEVLDKWQPASSLFSVSLGLAYKALEI